MVDVCVIIPTFNRARTLPRAIDSVLAQEHPHVRCVVVDDASTDDTTAVLDRYAPHPRVSIVRSPRNRGVTGAKNLGLDHLPDSTRYFCILDSDDVLLPHAIRALLPAFDRGDWSQAFGWCADLETGERTGEARGDGQVVTYRDAIAGRLTGEFWQLVRRDLLGELRFEERAAGGETALWWRLLKKAPGFLTSEVVRLYDRSGDDRVSRPRFDPVTARRKMWVYRAVLDAVGEDLRAVSRHRYAEYRLMEAKWAALAGSRREAGAALWDALRAAPTPGAWRVAALALLPTAVVRGAYARRYPERAPAATAR